MSPQRRLAAPATRWPTLTSTDWRKGLPLSAKHLCGDVGEPGAEPDVVEGEQLGVLLLELQRGLAPALHGLELAPQLGVLRVDAGIGAEVGDEARQRGGGPDRPVEAGGDPVDQVGADLFDPGVVDAPEQEQPEQGEGERRHREAAHAAQVVRGLITVERHAHASCRARLVTGRPP
ncbi:hypothetical protein CNY89_01630 [Amaricoccus sp. HAR-UPW-R2A-40]|nr:hypothetical protein CNY89_01630 [Amaricoccus sp. HAR-UPW-R2A-40]